MGFLRASPAIGLLRRRRRKQGGGGGLSEEYRLHRRQFRLPSRMMIPPATSPSPIPRCPALNIVACVRSLRDSVEASARTAVAGNDMVQKLSIANGHSTHYPTGNISCLYLREFLRFLSSPPPLFLPTSATLLLWGNATSHTRPIRDRASATARHSPELRNSHQPIPPRILPTALARVWPAAVRCPCPAADRI